MPEKKICTYRDEAEFIRVVCLEGKTGTMDCPFCGRTLQLGIPRCDHGVAIGLKCGLCQSVGIDPSLSEKKGRYLKTQKEIQQVLSEQFEEDREVKEVLVDSADEPDTEIELELETDEEIEYEET